MSNNVDAAPAAPPSATGRKILVVELWGLGDLTFSTPVLAAALEHDEVHLLGKEHARELLAASYPKLRFITYDAPWTAHRGKYRFWRWNWPQLIKLVGMLRNERYDVAVSVRDDPRDQFLMWLAGAAQRLGFMFEGARRRFDAGWLFLTKRLKRHDPRQHKVEDWHQIGQALDLPVTQDATPRLDRTHYSSGRIESLFEGNTKPVVCLHTGARIAVRRWPEKYFMEIVAELRRKFDFRLIAIPEPLTLPSSLADIADVYLTDLSVSELVDVLGRVDLLLCNDSGPGHIAVACSCPVIAVFGPGEPLLFRPWGDDSKVVMRDICKWRPCSDYCKFSEPHCMTKLLPSTVLPDIEGQIRSLIQSGKLPAALLKPDERSAFSNV